MSLENRLLNVTFNKCVKFYSEHKLEVDKCSEMLDAIMDN